MGLTNQSMGLSLLQSKYNVEVTHENQITIALAGNPNTGKSTVFNALTGLNQHTGNWPGKTVQRAQGTFKHRDKEFLVVDLPGTYSLLAHSVEEEVARDFACFGNPQVIIVVADATCLERNLNLALQVMEISNNVVVALNLMDEAERKGINIDVDALQQKLGVPVIPTVARDEMGIDKLINTVYAVATGKLSPKPYRLTYSEEIESLVTELETILRDIVGQQYNARWLALRLIDGDKAILRSITEILAAADIAAERRHLLFEQLDRTVKQALSQNNTLGDNIVATIYLQAETIAKNVVTINKGERSDWDKRLDDILTSRWLGYPVMLLLLGVVFWITITGANYPSQLLANLLFGIEERLTAWFMAANAPEWLHGILILGCYRTLAWVVSVMLPPMAIFFPLFTLLEDLGYLPRVAFNLDHLFRKACAHGKQALTMCMGFGCNAAGVIACRIIESPRERLIATLTNNFVPCNGRFPTLIALSSIFFGAVISTSYSSVVAALTVVALVVVGVFITLIVSRILSKTILEGIPSSFKLELPPYRRPQVGKILIRSLLDRTIFVLGRAVAVAAPAGLVIWVFANVTIGDISLLNHAAHALDPLAQLMGLDGFIIVAFLLGLPANEIVLPIVIMSYMSKGAMLEFDSLAALRELLVANGWTWLTGLNFMLFSLLHFPCGTTLWTIRKETGSARWTALAVLIPTTVAVLVTMSTTLIANVLGLL